MSDQSIGFKPSGHDAPTDLVIQGCIINHTNRTPAVTLIGISGPETLVRCKFTGNIVLGSQIFCTDAHQVTIQHNVVIVSSPERGNRIQAQVQRGGDAVLVTHNLLMNDQIGTPAMASLGEVNQRQVPRALVANNFCFTPFGSGIRCLSSDDAAIQNNMVVATASCTDSIFIRSETSNVENISVIRQGYGCGTDL